MRSAPPPTQSPAPAAKPDPSANVEAIIDRAIEAWRQGSWAEVRRLLEPIVGGVEVGAGTIEDPFARESALRYLAEATLLDPSLDAEEREELAHAYIARLLDENPEWAPPSGLHGRSFYDVVARVRSERDAQLAEACRGQLLACEADLTELRVDYGAAQQRIAALQEDLANEDVYITEVVKRNRGLAMLPFGVGHFSNGNFAIGGSFLALEVLTGAAALSLLVYRSTTLGCVRTDGLNAESLKCSAGPGVNIPKRQDDVERIRSAETIMGWAFIGSLALDIAVAQILFKPIEVVERGKKTRRELDAEIAETEAAATPRSPRRPTTSSGSSSGPAPEDSAPSPGSPSSALSEAAPSVRLRLQPHPTFVPSGIGFGMTLQF